MRDSAGMPANVSEPGATDPGYRGDPAPVEPPGSQAPPVPIQRIGGVLLLIVGLVTMGQAWDSCSSALARGVDPPQSWTSTMYAGVGLALSGLGLFIRRDPLRRLPMAARLAIFVLGLVVMIVVIAVLFPMAVRRP